MTKLPKYTLEYNENKANWNLTNDKTNKTVKAFDSKEDATSKGILEKSMEIRKLYEGVDFYAVNLLGQAIERGKFDEIVDELNSYYNDFLSKITPNLRRIPSETTAKIAEFFSKCHKELEMGC